MEYPTEFMNFWEYYGDKGTAKGSKREAYKSWQKVKKEWIKEEGEKPEEFCRHVKRGYLSVQANRKASRNANQFTANFPMAATWLNQWRFEEEHVESTGSFKAKAVDRNCRCGSADVFGRAENGSWICQKCELEEWKEHNTLKPLVDKHPKRTDENWREWSIRVMAQYPTGKLLKAKYGL